jgi:cold shock CspA family protein
MQTGLIERFDSAKGFGHIRPDFPDTAKSVFFISRKVDEPALLAAGACVSYRLGTDRTGRQEAYAIKVLGSADAQVSTQHHPHSPVASRCGIGSVRR